MTYKLIVKPEAEDDLLDSAKWYENQHKGLGLRFISAVDEKIMLIQQNPFKYQIRYKNTRFALIKRFPFAIHFIIENNEIYVIAILSTYRNPQVWK